MNIHVALWRVSLSVCSLLAMVPSAQGQTLSRGNQILLQKGLQIEGAADGTLNPSTFAQSNFTAVQVLYSDTTTLKSFNPAPGIPWGLLDTDDQLTSGQTPYQSNLLSLQFDDENDISDPTFLSQAQTALSTWRTNYPNAIGYTNQYGGEQTNAQMQNYMSVAKPDMLMFDYYPFNGNLAGGSPTGFYQFLQQYRQLGLAGNDGTGLTPIPTGTWLQSYVGNPGDPGNGDHIVSPSEIRLNQFAAWTFGYKFADSFVYSTTASANILEVPSALFVGDGDSIPRQPQFSAMAETNRESRNLGPSLVRLETTNVEMVLGQHMSGSHASTNSLPSGVSQWTSGSDSDPYLTGVSATNVGGANNGLRGDVLVGDFKPLQGASEPYLMITNGLTTPAGTVTDASQSIHLTFNFGATGITSLLELDRDTGLVDVIPLVHDSGSLYHLDLTLDGGTGDLFKYNDGVSFVVPEPSTAVLLTAGVMFLCGFHRWCHRS